LTIPDTFKNIVENLHLTFTIAFSRRIFIPKKREETQHFLYEGIKKSTVTETTQTEFEDANFWINRTFKEINNMKLENITNKILRIDSEYYVKMSSDAISTTTRSFYEESFS